MLHKHVEWQAYCLLIEKVNIDNNECNILHTQILDGNGIILPKIFYITQQYQQSSYKEMQYGERWLYALGHSETLLCRLVGCDKSRVWSARAVNAAIMDAQLAS